MQIITNFTLFQKVYANIGKVNVLFWVFSNYFRNLVNENNVFNIFLKQARLNNIYHKHIITYDN